MAIPIYAWTILAGWSATLAGVVSGAIVGVFFHRDDFLGGYGSFRRRLFRLGHISFFGLGFTNILFGLTLYAFGWTGFLAAAASIALIASVATMPVCCYLAGWRKSFRHLFPIPVVGAAGAIVLLLLHGRPQ